MIEQVTITKVDGQIFLSNGGAYGGTQFISGRFIIKALIAASQDNLLQEDREFFNEVLEEIYAAVRGPEWVVISRPILFPYICPSYDVPGPIAEGANDHGHYSKICLTNGVRCAALLGLKKVGDRFCYEEPQGLPTHLKAGKEVNHWEVIEKPAGSLLIDWRKERSCPRDVVR